MTSTKSAGPYSSYGLGCVCLYRFWLGPLVAHIKEVTARVDYHGEPWWNVVAEVADGTPEVHGNWREQELYLRESAIPETRWE